MARIGLIVDELKERGYEGMLDEDLTFLNDDLNFNIDIPALRDGTYVAPEPVNAEEPPQENNNPEVQEPPLENINPEIQAVPQQNENHEMQEALQENPPQFVNAEVPPLENENLQMQGENPPQFVNAEVPPEENNHEVHEENPQQLVNENEAPLENNNQQLGNGVPPENDNHEMQEAIPPQPQAENAAVPQGNNIPQQKQKPRKNDRFAAKYAIGAIYMTAEGALTDRNYRTRDERDFLVIQDEDHNLTNDDEVKATMQGFEGYEPPQDGKGYGTVYGSNTSANAEDMLGTQEAVTAVTKKAGDLALALKKEGEKRGDARVKRFYEDLSYIIHPKSGNFTQMEMTSPYMKNIIAEYIGLINPGREGSREEKDALGLPLYKAVYDFTHGIASEVQTEYNRQKLEEKGWTKESEQRYLRELRRTHTRILKAYDRLNTFADDPQGQTGAFMGNNLAHFFGRGEGETRHINPYIGMLRGENQAIENGWGKSELPILASIGSIEENIKKYERYGSDQQKVGMDEFKADFAKLKNACYYTQVASASAEERLQIANQVRDFLDSHNSPFAKKAMEAVVKTRKCFDQALEAIGEAAQQERDMDALPNDLRKNDPIAYLKGLEAKARQTKNTADIRRLIREQLGVNKENVDMLNRRDHAMDNAMSAFNNGMLDGEDGDFNRKYIEEFFQYKHLLTAQYALATEQLAKDIREGRATVDPALEPIRTDYVASMRIANAKVDNTELGKIFNSARDIEPILGFRLGENEFLSLSVGERDKFLRGSTDGLSRQQRIQYAKKGNVLATSLKDYGAEYDDISKKVTSPPQDDKVMATLKKNAKKTEKYADDFTDMKNRAAEMLERLEALKRAKPTATAFNKDGQITYKGENGETVDPKKCNSQSFMNMYNALQDVAKLSKDNTPAEVGDALYRLGSSAEAYQDSLKNQTFSAWSGNGKRRKNLSNELVTFAESHEKTLLNSAGAMCPDETIRFQSDRANNNLHNFEMWIAAKQQQRQEQEQRQKQQQAFAGAKKAIEEGAEDELEELEAAMPKVRGTNLAEMERKLKLEKPQIKNHGRKSIPKPPMGAQKPRLSI